MIYILILPKRKGPDGLYYLLLYYSSPLSRSIIRGQKKNLSKKIKVNSLSNMIIRVSQIDLKFEYLIWIIDQIQIQIK